MQSFENRSRLDIRKVMSVNPMLWQTCLMLVDEKKRQNHNQKQELDKNYRFN